MSGTEIDLPETMRVEDADDAAAENRQPSPRELMMRSIAERHNAVREQELAQAAIYDQDARDAGLSLAEDEPDPPPAAVEPVQEPVAPTRQDAPAPVPAAAPQLRTVDMDGSQWAVTEDQYQQLARLGMVTQRALQEYRAPAVEQAPPQPLVDPERVRDAVKRIQYGNEDEAAAALTQVVTDVASRIPTAPAIDQNALQARAAQLAVQQVSAQMQFAADKQIIASEYADIMGNPALSEQAAKAVRVLGALDASEGRKRPDIEIYREAGDLVRSRNQLPRPGTDAPSPSPGQSASVASRADVVERKRQAPRMTQGADRRAPQPEAARAPTGSEIVDRMRAQRGQASMR
jgi:hypothetical protein